MNNDGPDDALRDQTAEKVCEEWMLGLLERVQSIIESDRKYLAPEMEPWPVVPKNGLGALSLVRFLAALSVRKP